jgi:5-deoxy-glucuronate isomerase
MKRPVRQAQTLLSSNLTTYLAALNRKTKEPIVIDNASSLSDKSRLVFRDTAARQGRFISVSPANSAMKHLSYGRIRLDADSPPVSLETAGSEVALICLHGEGSVRVRDSRTNKAEIHNLATYDAIYVPRGYDATVSTPTTVDVLECSAPVDGDYPLQVVRYPDVEKNPALKFAAGKEASSRTLNVLIGNNVRAGRLLAGFTRSAPGHWTSWPPHEHTAMLEEMYVYFDMPPPAFGLQMVYTRADEPELVQIVRDGDAVLMPGGYHPNVAAPGHPINFVWLMAAHRESQDRVFGVVNVEPAFQHGGGGSGLDAARK